MSRMHPNNSVNVTGNLTRDTKFIPARDENGQDVCFASIAVDRHPGKKDDKTVDYPEIAIYGPQAKVIHENTVKGSKIQVLGALRTRTDSNLFDADGNKTSRTITSVAAHDVQILTWPHLAGKEQPDTDQGGFGQN